jgi:hypothetical protein
MEQSMDRLGMMSVATTSTQVREKNYAGIENHFHIHYEKGATLVPGTVKLLRQRKKKGTAGTKDCIWQVND